jgi:hypothetical protein
VFCYGLDFGKQAFCECNRVYYSSSFASLCLCTFALNRRADVEQNLSSKINHNDFVTLHWLI